MNSKSKEVKTKERVAERSGRERDTEIERERKGEAFIELCPKMRTEFDELFTKPVLRLTDSVDE